MNSEYIWETFDSLFKTVGRQGHKVEDLEKRVEELEKRLAKSEVSDKPKEEEGVLV